MDHSRIFNCEPCHFVTTCKRDYERHILTQKHIDGGGCAITPIKTSDGYSCPCCQKIFKSRTSVYKHTPLCKTVVTSSPPTAQSASILPGTTEPQISEDIAKHFMNMMMMFHQNTEFQSKMIEMCKNCGMSNSHNTNSNNIINANTTNNTTNSHNINNTFNMNMFLNEKCKDAMNMKEFVNSIELNMTDLENVGRLGYVEGMSNIFIDNLQKTDVYKRPVHCSDIKRETLYVKENNEWQRDCPKHEKMTNAVLAVEHKNVVLVNEWAKANPRCMDSSTRENEKYFRLSRIVTDGEKDGNIDKVIRKVAKRVTIEKDPTPQLE